MERLTARSPKNNMAYLVNVKTNEQGLEGSYNTLMCVKDAFELLTKYEEAGLTPEQIQAQQQEIEQLQNKLEQAAKCLDTETRYKGKLVSQIAGKDEQIDSLVADKDQQAGTIMRMESGLKQAKSMLLQMSCSPTDGYDCEVCDICPAIKAISALLGGAEDA